MFDTEGEGDIRAVGRQVLATESRSHSDAEQIDRIRQLERLAAHVQAQLMMEVSGFLARRRAAGDLPAESARHLRLDAANDEVALARGVGAVTAALHASMAEVLMNDLPACFEALDRGAISMHAARVIVKESEVLSPQQRGEIDAALALESARLAPGQVRDAVRARVLAVDAQAAGRRAAKARSSRQVGLLRKADGVALLFARLPAEAAVACWQALDGPARTARGAGDQRSINDIICDTFIARLTGTDPAEPAKVEIGVVVSAATWLGADHTPATLPGYGAIHPDVVRQIVHRSHPWLRRLLVDPIDGQVLSIDSRARKVTGLLRTFGTYRDQTCRRPYCSNPIRDFNHISEHGNGGRTNHRNTDGLCEPCHISRHQAGWTQRAEPGSGRVWWQTPTGHRYPSDPPPALGHGTMSASMLWILARLAITPRRSAAR